MTTLTTMAPLHCTMLCVTMHSSHIVPLTLLFACYQAQNDHVPCVEALMAVDDVQDMADKEGRTALMWAASKGRLLSFPGSLSTGFYSFEFAGCAASVEAMAAGGRFDVNTADASGATALHIASFAGNHECVTALCKV